MKRVCNFLTKRVITGIIIWLASVAAGFSHTWTVDTKVCQAQEQIRTVPDDILKNTVSRI